ncbi:DUF7940 domain-containing protein [Subtercola sp. YIM 133946]|uniref:DUF7940 domain-containing protein n=1 Tax=Subtercola sp. YIM 133946 TaxID=3118909 RepID=UPI002F947C30
MNTTLVQVDQKPAAAGTPTQVANPSRAGWRTFVQSAIGFLVAANAALGVLAGFLAANPGLNAYLPPEVFAFVNVAVVIAAGVSKFVAQLMANPTVNEWIKAHLSFLSAIPVIDAGTAMPDAPAVITSVTDTTTSFASPAEVDPTPSDAEPKHVALGD